MWWLMISVFVIYNLTILLKYGCLNSISASYYSLPVKYNWLFLVFCWGYAIPAIFMAHDGFMFFAGGMICFVGIASAFRSNSFTANVHQYSSFAAVVLSQLSIMFVYHMYYLNIIMIVSAIVLYLLSKKIAQWMYILEVIAFITVSIALYA
jgi:hypothetical protein